MKQLVHVSLVSTIALALSGCGGSTEEPGSTSAEGAFPDCQVRLVIPYSPGGGTDIIFRTVASYAEESLGREIVPVNMPGASATVGSREVKNAEPDGCTLLGSHDTIITANLAGIVDYGIDAFEPVSLLTKTPNIAVVGKDLNVENASEFQKYVTDNAGDVAWGITPGSTSHFFAQMMVERMGLPDDSVRLVAYDGTSSAATAVLAGDLQGVMSDYATSESQLESGDLESIGVAHEERLAQFPDEETFIEQGIDMTHATNRGVYAPTGTPEEIVTILDEAFQAAMADPELIEEIEDLGSVPTYMPAEEYKDFLIDLEAEMTELSKGMEF